MDKMFVVKSLQYRPEDDPDVSWSPVDALGFSIVRLMQLSDGKATGVRADLQVQDADALDELAQYYTTNTRLEWWFEAGGGGGSFGVVLRWTKFDRFSGNLQVVRTAVLRDLIREVEGTDTEVECTSDGPPNRVLEGASSLAGERTASSPEVPHEPHSDDGPLIQHVADLWPRLLGEDGRLKSKKANRG